MENFKPMNPDGQFNLNFNKDENIIIKKKEDDNINSIKDKINPIKDEKQEISTEYDLEEEIERQMMEKENPSEEYYGRFNVNRKHESEKEKPEIEKTKTKKQLKPKYKDNHGRNFTNGLLGPFDPLK